MPKHQTQPFIFGVKPAVLNSKSGYSKVERPVTRERRPKNKIIRAVDGISYLMRANYSELRRPVREKKEMIQCERRRRHGGAASPSPSEDVKLLCSPANSLTSAEEPSIIYER